MKVPEPKKLPSGNWNIYMRLGGQNVSITKSNKKDCIRAAELIKAEYRSGKRERRCDPGSITLSEAYDKYIAMREQTLSPSTIRGYYELKRNTFLGIMDKPIKLIKSEQIQAEINGMVLDGKSPKRVANATGFLQSVLKLSYPEFKMDVTTPQKVKPKQRGVTEDEILKLLPVVRGSEAELPILMALWMGMRRSEILAVKYEDIEGNVLHISRAAVIDKDDKLAEKPPKTFSGDRYIAIPDYMLKLIGTGTGNIVRLNGRALIYRLHKACEAAGIPAMRFHDLRHANAAAMIALGVDGRTAQERNGWASEYLYKQVYGYVTSHQVSAADRAINGYFEHLLSKNADENADAF